MDSDSDSHSARSDSNSDDEYNYEFAYFAAAELPDTNGKVQCTCGCGKRRTIRTVYRHLKRLRETQILAKNNGYNYTMAAEALGTNKTHLGENPEIEMRNEDEVPDLPMHYDSDRKPDPPPDSPESWYEFGTPPPSPTLLQLSNDEVSSDEEHKYQEITANDCREYDRWYAEDCQEELDEFLSETITETELDSIKMMAIRQFGHISFRNYERIRYSFRSKIFLLTLQRLGTRLAGLSGIKTETYDCCANVCLVFTGDFAENTACSACKQPRFDELGRPRKVWQYIPIIGRFLAMFNHPDFIAKLEYRYNYVQRDGRIDDFFDSELYKNLCRQNIVIDGEDLGVPYFSGKYDIATSVLADGVQIFKQETATCWPIMLQILNLPPRDQCQLRNVLPLCVIPGPKQPKDFQSFLEPFVLESLQLARGVRAFNSRTQCDFLLRIHPVLVGGDMQAIKHLEEMKGVNAKVPCRGCESIGVYHSDKKTYLIPLAAPLSADNPTPTTNAYNLLDLQLQTEARMARQTEKIKNAETTAEYEGPAKKYGITGPTILDRIPSLQRPRSYPHKFLHLFLLNHVPDLITLWIGGHPLIPDAGCEHYLISKVDWVAIGRETEAATNLVPSLFCRRLPNIRTEWRLFCGESWSFWVLYIGPIVLRNRLPKKYYDHFLELVAVIKCLTQYENITERIEQLRLGIAGYVERYEE
ncbi:hypothetical protein FRC07_012429 [Ceratobasidium sp. 392]|nr:hypothetical protein FRC07_012429 [Ceratobasidium sp. 392]